MNSQHMTAWNMGNVRISILEIFLSLVQEIKEMPQLQIADQPKENHENHKLARPSTGYSQGTATNIISSSIPGSLSLSDETLAMVSSSERL